MFAQQLLILNKNNSAWPSRSHLARRNIAAILVFSMAVGVFSHQLCADDATLGSDQIAEVVHDTQLAQSLENRNDVTAIQQAITAASDGQEKALFDSALIYCQWNQTGNDPARQAQMAREFVQDVNEYLQFAGAQADPDWEIAQAKFILADITPAYVNPIEYWSGTPEVQAALLEPADLARRLLETVYTHYSGLLNALNNATNFTDADQKMYLAAMNGQTESQYYLAFAEYYTGLASTDKADKWFLSAVNNLRQWTSGSSDSGVYYQALLLSGKANFRAARYDDALDNLTKAQSDAAPLWLQYEARYQLISAQLTAGRYDDAHSSLVNFEAWLASNADADTLSARMGALLLDYRITWAQSQTMQDPDQRHKTAAQAMGILLEVISQAPQYQGLVFSHLVQDIPANADLATLEPMQILAYAWYKAQNDDRQDNIDALAATDLLLSNKTIDAQIRDQAYLIAGISNGRLERLQKAVEMNLAFLGAEPQDPRAKSVLDLALSQLQMLNAAPTISPDVRKLTSQALQLAYVHFHEAQWRMPYAIELEQDGRNQEALELLSQIPPDDPLYLDARYQMVRLDAAQLAALQSGKASLEDQQNAARIVIQSCQDYVSILEHPPAGADQLTIERAQGYQTDVLLLEAGTALDPLLQPMLASSALDRLDKLGNQLSPQDQGIVLRYRIREYQLANQTDKIITLIRSYAQQSSQNATDIIEGLIGQYDDESRRVEDSDPNKAQQLAKDAAALLQQLIDYIKAEPGDHSREIYAYQQLLGDEVVRSGDGEQGKKIFAALDAENRADLTNRIGYAHACLVAGDYQNAHNLYVNIIPKLEPGSDLFWEAYLYLIESNEKLDQYQDETKSALESLETIYGSQIGGKYYHDQFTAFLQEYNIDD
jgi:hypothetical protein